MNFTQEELNNLLIFMNRVELKGNESLPHAILMQKIGGMITPKKEEEPAQEVEKVEKK